MPAFDVDTLYKLLRDFVEFTWGPEQKESFASSKQAPRCVPALGYFTEGVPTEILTDASRHGISAVLAQNGQEGSRVVSYAGRTLTKCELNYSITERECLGVVWVVFKFCPYIYGSQFKMVTDHHALCWLSNPKYPSGRVDRLPSKLQDSYFPVVYKSGKRHLDADSLTRRPLPSDAPQSNVTHLAEQTAFLDDMDMDDAQRKHPSLEPIIRNLSCEVPLFKSHASPQAQLCHLHDCITSRRNNEPHTRPCSC